MKLWFEFELHSEPWCVYLVDSGEVEDVGDSELAHCDYQARRIVVWSGTSPESRAMILVHEFLHASITPQEGAFHSLLKERKESNDQKEESLVQLLSFPLAQILKSAGLLRLPDPPK